MRAVHRNLGVATPTADIYWSVGDRVVALSCSFVSPSLLTSKYQVAAKSLAKNDSSDRSIAKTKRVGETEAMNYVS